MTKVDFGSAENLVRIGLLVTFVAVMLLMGTAFAEIAKLSFWMALVILLLETFKLPPVSASNAAVSELILSATMVAGGCKGLVSSLGKTFTEYHIFLLMFIAGTLTISFAAYKRLSANGKK